MGQLRKFNTENEDPRLVTTSIEFDGLKLNHQRKCKLTHETEGFMFLNQYSRKGCELECAAKTAISICKCIPWFYPNDYNNWPMCDMFGAYCFELIMGDDAYYKKCPSQCLTDCKETEFILFFSSTPLDLNSVCGFGNFHQEHFKHDFKKHFAFLNYQTLIKNGSIPDLATSLSNDSLCKKYVENYVAFVSVQGAKSLYISRTESNFYRI